MKHIVEIHETLVYKIEVEGAKDLNEAVEMAYNSEKFCNNIPDDNDSVVVDINVIDIETVE